MIYSLLKMETHKVAHTPPISSKTVYCAHVWVHSLPRSLKRAEKEGVVCMVNALVCISVGCLHNKASPPDHELGLVWPANTQGSHRSRSYQETEGLV